MKKLFGTDGVRGIVNTELTALDALNIGMAVATSAKKAGGHASVIIGKDPRASSDMLEAAAAAGAAACGADVVLCGCVPTPAVSFLVRSEGAGAGIMISASHNPFTSNGLKVFGGDGVKLSAEEEGELEKIVASAAFSLSPPGRTGAVRPDETLAGKYINSLTVKRRGALSGMRVALDCGNGSASPFAEQVFRLLGCGVTVIGDRPDGVNINDGFGSTAPEKLAELVKSGRFDAGFAFDGDGDRCIAFDETGETIDGDGELAVLAPHFASTGALPGDAVVTTVMANLGFLEFLKERGFSPEITGVGDRCVLGAMLETGAALGGEQSGHIISLSHAVTGDGMQTGILLLEAMRAAGKKLSELASAMTKYPQYMKNVAVDNGKKAEIMENPEVKAAVAEAEAALAGTGRVLVRPSGTEPLIRVMAEGKDEKTVRSAVERVARAVSSLL